MKAIVYKKYGSPDVLEQAELEKPVPGDDEILIRSHAAEATKADCELRGFQFAVKWFWLPLRLALGLFKPRRPVLGGYFAGVVEAVGKDVTRFKAGDKIFGSAALRMGAYAEYLCLPESYTIALKPEKVSFAEVAAVPLGGFNALHYMRKAKIQKGERVLINGAGGSIGVFGLQIARARGAEVTAVDSPLKEKFLRQMGAAHFVDYTKEDFTKSGQAYDVIFDMVASSSYSGCVGALKPGGRYLMANPRLADMLRSVFTSRSGKRAMFAFAGETQEELEELSRMIVAGEIKPVVDKIYPLEQARDAHRRVEAEERLGPVVIATGNATEK